MRGDRCEEQEKEEKERKEREATGVALEMDYGEKMKGNRPL